MDVYYHDIVDKLTIGNATRVQSSSSSLRLSTSLRSMWTAARRTPNLIGQPEFALMKDGVLFLNLSPRPRGGP